jgi:hypothetical protein
MSAARPRDASRVRRAATLRLGLPCAIELHELHLVGVRERLVGVIQVSAACRGPL